MTRIVTKLDLATGLPQLPPEEDEEELELIDLDEHEVDYPKVPTMGYLIGRDDIDRYADVAPTGGPIADEPDLVNQPGHYTSHPSGVECIEVTEHLSFCLGNAVKYINRAGKKDKASELEDLKKAEWYLRRRISQLEPQV